jgi:hypothetical protein
MENVEWARLFACWKADELDVENDNEKSIIGAVVNLFIIMMSLSLELLSTPTNKLYYLSSFDSTAESADVPKKS